MIGWIGRQLLVRPVAAVVGLLWPALPRRTTSLVRLRIRGRLVEERPPSLPFAPARSALLADVTTLLRDLAREPRVAGVRIDVGPLELGMGRLQEIRRAIQALRDGGKHVHVHLETGGLREYLLAVAAHRISMAPMASLDLVGLRGDVTYLGSLLASAGIHPDFEAVGDYKAFAERFVRSGPTAAARENGAALLRDTWDQVVSAVSAGRGMERSRAAELLGSGPFGAEQAVALGLVDDTAYPEQVRALVHAAAGKHRWVPGARYAARRRRLRTWRHRVRPGPAVAVVTASGQILDRAGAATAGALTPGRLSRQIKALRKDDGVAAVVLRVDSPGGSAVASDRMWHDLRRLAERKPLVASMGDVAASGGYYLAMAAHRVLAQPGTLTGSIGVVGGKMNVSGLLDRLGLHRERLSVGAHAGFDSADGDFTESERARLRERMLEFYRVFVDKAAAGRGLDPEEIEPHAGGRVWTGRQARRRRLVDEMGGLHEAIGIASSLAGYDEPLTALWVSPQRRPWRWLAALAAWPRQAILARVPSAGWLLLPQVRRGGLLARMPFDIRLL